MSKNMDSYKITRRAMELILEEVDRRVSNGESQSAISRLVGCDRATVHRWYTERIVRENTSFRDMVRYLDRLRIPLVKVFGSGDDLPPPSPDRAMTVLDKAIASTLVAAAKALGKDYDDVSRELESLDLPDVESLLKGREPMRASDFSKMCRAVGVSPEAVLKRASGITEE
ncbi:hypothetical protein [Pseudodesulfovibrio sediminis]|uniref:Uncharacterized protein n=1 Tax=Pseudodesulfovibrio sediminis TaxID=2810563 RepID=A0ABM7PAD9_9BACT|nr:hypothetical protein [Pseudodesulfovibrio sediminis]BCS89993.1 hypothetical protein PSDVSF_32350 [Pseudodesulfovibrio sediminis]